MSNNNKMQIFPSDVMAEAINKLPRGTKSKFVNLGVECVLADTSLRNKVLAQLMGFDLSSELKTSSSDPVNYIDYPKIEDNVTEPTIATDAKKITAGNIRFNK